MSNGLSVKREEVVSKNKQMRVRRDVEAQTAGRKVMPSSLHAESRKAAELLGTDQLVLSHECIERSHQTDNFTKLALTKPLLGVRPIFVMKDEHNLHTVPAVHRPICAAAMVLRAWSM